MPDDTPRYPIPCRCLGCGREMLYYAESPKTRAPKVLCSRCHRVLSPLEPRTLNSRFNVPKR